MESYEKKYKEALEVAKRKLCFDKAGMVDSFTPNDIYEIFPELKESYDEKIRKELIAIYSVGAKGDMKTGDIPDRDIVAWLEKQGEQKQEEKPRYNIGDVICDKSCTTLNKEAQPNMEIVDIKNGMYICDKGSFPVSQQDEYELVSKKIDTKLNDDSVSNGLRAASVKHAEKELKNHTFPNNEEFELVYTFEEGAKWQAAQKHTLNKEDEEMLNLIIERLHSHPDIGLEEYSKEYDWLNSSKERPTWKPSDEQMAALNHVVNLMGASKFQCENDYCYNMLKSLRDQLKKL